jgi:3-ketosteroid 9alpha-monooxygenase subunit A
MDLEMPAQDSALPATRNFLTGMTPAERAAWRLADQPGRPSADARNLPDEYPFGWYIIEYSAALRPGEVKPLRYFGKELVLWRGEDGAANVLDAYCAHYGAHMGHGGKVHGNLLECPFHAWRYAGNGAVLEIPYSPSIPPQARRQDCVPSWPVREVNGMIWIWYHPARGKALWEPVRLEEIGHPDWTAYTTFEWNVYCSLENMTDNNIDISHFKFVHGAPLVPEYTFSFERITRSVVARIKFTTPRGHVDGEIDSITHGPGQGWVRFKGLSETLLVTGLTPVARDHLKVRFAFTQPVAQAENPATARLARALLADICQQLDQDKVILDRYTRRDRPLICEADGPFGRNRAYFAQFYAGMR